MKSSSLTPKDVVQIERVKSAVSSVQSKVGSSALVSTMLLDLRSNIPDFDEKFPADLSRSFISLDSHAATLDENSPVETAEFEQEVRNIIKRLSSAPASLSGSIMSIGDQNLAIAAYLGGPARSADVEIFDERMRLNRIANLPTDVGDQIEALLSLGNLATILDWFPWLSEDNRGKIEAYLELLL